tara:strand:- start:47 stop:640 length:594 start_codon:yes stop_codon:yes gene_type:complete
MSLLYTTITGPINPAVSVDDCKLDLRIESSFTLDDDLILSYINASSKLASEITGRKLISETIKYSIESAESNGGVTLPFNPVSSVTEIQYFDTDNVSQALDVNDFYLYNFDDKSVLCPKEGIVWPTVNDRRDAINITFVAGYGLNSSDIPVTITRAIRLLVTHYYENRNNSVLGMSVTEIPFSIETLLNTERVGWLA